MNGMDEILSALDRGEIDTKEALRRIEERRHAETSWLDRFLDMLLR
jgi:hypothetical protein